MMDWGRAFPVLVGAVLVLLGGRAVRQGEIAVSENRGFSIGRWRVVRGRYAIWMGAGLFVLGALMLTWSLLR